MLKFKYLISAVFILCFMPLARADYLNLNAGYFDIMREKDPTALFGAEYRFDPLLYGIGFTAGAFVTANSSAYGYAGLEWNIPITDHIYVLPSGAVGLYSRGNGKFLGGPVIFHAGVEVGYQFENNQRLGLVLNHMSNADLYNRNPSDENLLISYSIPIATVGQWMGL